jgi:hypothetical protein
MKKILQYSKEVKGFGEIYKNKELFILFVKEAVVPMIGSKPFKNNLIQGNKYFDFVTLEDEAFAFLALENAADHLLAKADKQIALRQDQQEDESDDDDDDDGSLPRFTYSTEIIRRKVRNPMTHKREVVERIKKGWNDFAFERFIEISEHLNCIRKQVGVEEIIEKRFKDNLNELTTNMVPTPNQVQTSNTRKRKIDIYIEGGCDIDKTMPPLDFYDIRE